MKNYTITFRSNFIEVSGNKGTYSHDYSTYSMRTKVYRNFISQVLNDYGTQAIYDITFCENNKI